MTASMVHVNSLTPGSECNPTVRERELELREEREARRDLENQLNQTEGRIAEGNATDEAVVGLYKLNAVD
jgi:hypothetical protein